MTRQILIVDDDEDDCDLFCDAARMVDSQIECEKVYSAANALMLLQKGYRPDFIFLDLNMPVFDGKSCLAEIRKIQTLLVVPVIIYSTSKRQDDKDKTRALGANYFLTKPSSLTELCHEISLIFEKEWDYA